jgi:hypothetical protein
MIKQLSAKLDVYDSESETVLGKQKYLAGNVVLHVHDYMLRKSRTDHRAIDFRLRTTRLHPRSSFNFVATCIGSAMSCNFGDGA